MRKKKIIAIIETYIADLKAGKQKGWWDVPHKPTETEREGRVKLLESILLEIKRGE